MTDVDKLLLPWCAVSWIAYSGEVYNDYEFAELARKCIGKVMGACRRITGRLMQVSCLMALCLFGLSLRRITLTCGCRTLAGSIRMKSLWLF